MEVIDAYGTAIGQQYVLARMNVLKDTIDLMTSLPAPNTPSLKVTDHVDRLLLEEDTPLLQSILLNFKRYTKQDPFTPEKKPEPVKPTGVKKNNICFLHHPAKKGTCHLGDRCNNLHLDTTAPTDLERWNRAKASFDANKAKSARA